MSGARHGLLFNIPILLLIPFSIVAVHGLNGDAFKSFTASNSKKFWLGNADMLPQDIPNCRVLTFSYPASVAAVFGRTSSATILQHATTLVQELIADRQVSRLIFGSFRYANAYVKMEKAMERPIIFLCHSLGGIIVKRVRMTLGQVATVLTQDRHSSTQKVARARKQSTYIQSLSRHTGFSSSEHLTMGAARQISPHLYNAWSMCYYHLEWSTQIHNC